MVDIRKLKKEQFHLAKKLILKDSFKEIKTIAGVDQAFFDNKIISAIVVLSYPNFDFIESKYVVEESPLQYIPGYLSFREGPPIIKAFNLLENKPDVLMVEGHGISHMRKMGLASFVGIMLDIPVIGVAKQILVGDIVNDKVYIEDELRGTELRTKEGARPIFVSPGHKISVKTAFEIAKNCIRQPHKLPEPLHIAHKYANNIKKKQKENLESK